MDSADENKRVRGSGIREQRSVVERQVTAPCPSNPVPRTPNPDIKRYRDLEVWQKSMDLVVDCYRITKRFPKNEDFGLTSQLQRSAVSIPANIAEGRERQHTKEFIQHISIAYGSLAELETHIQIAERLNYIDKSQAYSLMDKTAVIGRMLNSLRKSLGNRKQEEEAQNV